MSVDITKFVCSSAELVGKMRRSQFRRVVRRFISEGRQLCVVVADTVFMDTL